jgi:hypothetical protein
MRIEQPEITRPNGEIRVFPAIGERVPVIGCYSEIMMHFGLAGRPCEVSLEYQVHWTDDGPVPRPDWGPGCQAWRDGEKFSGLILTSEGGFYRCSDHGKETLPEEAGYYIYMRAPDAVSIPGNRRSADYQVSSGSNTEGRT